MLIYTSLEHSSKALLKSYDNVLTINPDPMCTYVSTLILYPYNSRLAVCSALGVLEFFWSTDVVGYLERKLPCSEGLQSVGIL